MTNHTSCIKQNLNDVQIHASALEGLENLLIYLDLVPSVTSVVGNLFIIVSYRSFANLQQQQGLEFVVWLSFGDLIFSASSFVQGCSDWELTVASAMCQFGSVASIMWTIAFATALHAILVRKQPLTQARRRVIHLFVWSSTVVLTVAPLAMISSLESPGRNGGNDDFAGDLVQWCWVSSYLHQSRAGRGRSLFCAEAVWRMVSYIFLWARALFLFRTYGQIMGVLREHAAHLSRDDGGSTKLFETLRRLQLYPVILIPVMIFDSCAYLLQLVFDEGTHDQLKLIVFLVAIPTISMQGTLNFVVYGLNPAVRAEWSRTLSKVKGVFQVAGARRSEFELEAVEHFSIDRSGASPAPLRAPSPAVRLASLTRSLRSSGSRASSEVERPSAAKSETDPEDGGAANRASPNPLRDDENPEAPDCTPDPQGRQ